MSWYRSGTVSVANGSASVTGVGTLWASMAVAGDIFTIDGVTLFVVASIVSDTSLTLTGPYSGATASNSAYLLERQVSSSVTPPAVSVAVSDFVAKWNVTLDELIAWMTATGNTTLTNPTSGAQVTVRTPSQISADQAASVAAVTASETAAAASAVTAQAQVSLATTQAGNASTSATAASGSATAAAGSASEATIQATNSANSATASAGSAATATTQAGNALSSATASANSATSSANSATAAQSSAVGANTSALSASASKDSAVVAAASAINSANSATASAVSASASKDAAALSASGALSSAASAGSSATSALNSASSATTSASSAGVSAATATAKATEAAVSAAGALNTYGSISAISAAVASALSSMSAAGSSASAASASAASALTSAGTSQQYSTALAAIASQTAIVPAATVAGFNGTVVASCIYDTRKDSDGGAWRKRCQNTSWYNEVTTATGKWLGNVATEASARAVSGATTGDYFYNTTTKLFYSLNATSGVTQVYRGSRKEFPEVVAITAEAGRVVIWDLTDSSVPMWKSFGTGGSQYLVDGYGYPISCILALNGELYIGVSATLGGQDPTGLYGGVLQHRFIMDASLKYKGKFNGSASGYAAFGTNYFGGDSAYNRYPVIPLVSGIVNSIAATVLPNAPIDPATGLPVPTIAVGTAGGVSVIKDDGTVVNSTATGNSYGLSITGTTLWIDFLGGVSSSLGYKDLVGIASSWAFTFVTQPSTRVTLLDTSKQSIASQNLVYSGTNQGVLAIKNNPSSPTSGIVAAITNTYNSGWQVGDTRGAWLADTVAETVSGVELITNGNFTTDVSGWTAVGTGCSLTKVGNAIRVTNGANGFQFALQDIATVPGKTYTIQCNIITDAISGTPYVYAVNSSDTVALFVITTASLGLIDGQFTATNTITKIRLGTSSAALTGEYCEFANISVKECSADRSVKANPLTVVGTLTKSPVAAGSQLMAYSGFSVAGSYLMQPYNSNLAIGTGDISISLWVKGTVNGANQVVFDRGGTTVTIHDCYFTSTGSVVLRFGGSFVNGTKSVLDGNWHSLILIRRAGVASIFVDAVLDTSVVNSYDLTDTSADLYIGLRQSKVAILSNASLALFRISATAPSDDQIRYMYETERKLFEPNAQCCIQGTSTAVTAMDYDDQTDLLHVGTSWGVTEFQGLKAVKSYAQAGVTSIAAKSGYELISGTAGTSFYKPSRLLAEELTRTWEQRKAFGSTLVPFEFDAIAAQTAFVAPLGYSVKFVYSAGALKRLGTGKDYTISNDGFRDTVNFAVAPGASVWVSILCVRNV